MCQIKNRSTFTPKLMGVELCNYCEYLLLYVWSQVQTPQDSGLDLRALKTTEPHVAFEYRLLRLIPDSSSKVEFQFCLSKHEGQGLVNKLDWH